MNIKQCPVCDKQMNYNGEGLQKNPKAPQWKCSDINCKFQWDKRSNQYMQSKYITSVWDNSPSVLKNSLNQASQPPTASTGLTNAQEIRANVALKMCSELISAGNIDVSTWKTWADEFYHYEPSEKKPLTETERMLEEPPFPDDVPRL